MKWRERLEAAYFLSWCLQFILFHTSPLGFLLLKRYEARWRVWPHWRKWNEESFTSPNGKLWLAALSALAKALDEHKVKDEDKEEQGRINTGNHKKCLKISSVRERHWLNSNLPMWLYTCGVSWLTLWDLWYCGWATAGVQTKAATTQKGDALQRAWCHLTLPSTGIQLTNCSRGLLVEMNMNHAWIRVLRKGIKWMKMGQ